MNDKKKLIVFLTVLACNFVFLATAGSMPAGQRHIEKKISDTVKIHKPVHKSCDR